MTKEPPNKGFICRRCGELPLAGQHSDNCGHRSGKWWYFVRRASRCKNYHKKGDDTCRTELFDEHDDAAMSWLERFGIIDNRPLTKSEAERGLEIAKESGLLADKTADPGPPS